MAQLQNLNPLRTGAALPANLLLMVKILAVSFIVHGNLAWIVDPYLPFIRALDGLRTDAHVLQWLSIAAFVVFTALLLTNTAVRVSSFVLGALILFNVLASRPSYQTNLLFCACLFILTGLYTERFADRFLRLQVGLLYFGAGLNKLLEADWRSGQMFQNWSRLLV